MPIPPTPTISMNIQTPFKSPLRSFFDFQSTTKPVYSTYNFGSSISTSFPQQRPIMNPVLSILEEGESTKEEREVTDILQNEEDIQQDEGDMPTRSYKDKGKSHAMPFEYASIARISPIPSSTSTRRSVPLPPIDPEPDPDPTNQVKEILWMKHPLCHVLLLRVHPLLRIRQTPIPIAKKMMTIEVDKVDKEIPAQEENEVQEETLAQEAEQESEASKDQ
ncbi:hypothetical protein ARMGADRAFT_1075015 [Armillaria gallica]|uniref:Uncharacterized protein n=1 Tax=Armillaria gallica TaxID=47427 RepID=A0A2H3ECB9_ARMGA|nr:hypothetical protein ARMGADRAFT_1075015 [Armillaria gallica]